MNAKRTLTVLVCLFITQNAFAAGGDMQLILEIWVNERTKHVVAPIIERDGALLANPQDLADAGIKTSPAEQRADGLVDMYKLQGVNIQFSEADQRLSLAVPKERLIAQKFDLKPENKTTVTGSGTGFIGQYDLVGTMDDVNRGAKTASAGAVLGGTYFTPKANVTATGFTQTANGHSDGVRLDTAIETDDPDTLRRVVVGDAITGSQSWSRSARFAGVQIGTDFSLRPDLNTMPLPAFFGQTAVPANVDVFVNSARVFETGVEPGPFEINNLPTITGNGEASVVVKDVLGRETTVLLPFYASSNLLREGLTSYDLDFGMLRRGYGQRSFDYGDVAGSATYSKGISDWFTVESHTEATDHAQLAGGGGVFAVGKYGIIHPSLAVSHSSDLENAGNGVLYSLSFENQTHPVGFFGTMEATSGHYNDIASHGSEPPPELQMQVGSNLALGNYGSVAGSLIGMKRVDGEISRIATASYSVSFGGRYNFGTTAFYDQSHGEFVTQAFLSIALGGDLMGSTNVQAAHHSNFQQVGLTQPANPDGGFGYRMQASTGDNAVQEADATWVGQHGTYDGDIASRDGDPAVRLSASSGVVIMDGGVYAARRSDGAVALVRTGKAGTGVYQENRQVATADDNGDALVTGLVPFAPNRLSIDPSNYNFSTIVDDTEKNVVPARNSGVLVDFTPVPRFPALVMLRLKDDTPPPAGSHVNLSSGGGTLIVGHRGELFIPDLQGPVEGKVEYGNETCMFSTIAPPPAANGAIPRLGPIYCLAEGAP